MNRVGTIAVVAITTLVLVGFALAQQNQKPSAFGELNKELSQQALNAMATMPGPKTGGEGKMIPATEVDVWFEIHVGGRIEYVRWSAIQGFIPSRDGSVRTSIIHSGGHSVGVLRNASDLVPAMVTAVNAAYLSAAQGTLLPVTVIRIDGGPAEPPGAGR